MKPLYIKLACVAVAAGIFFCTQGQISFDQALAVLTGLVGGLALPELGAKE